MLKTILFFIAATIIVLVGYFGWSLITASSRIGTFCEDLSIAKSKTEVESMIYSYSDLNLKLDKTIQDKQEYWRFYEYRTLGLTSCKISFKEDKVLEKAHQ